MTAADKRLVFARYGLADTGHWTTTKNDRSIWRTDYEVDHLIPLELGGSNSIENLWPESYVSDGWNAHTKDRLENRLHQIVCAGEMPLSEAQQVIATDWIAAYKKYVGDMTER